MGLAMPCPSQRMSREPSTPSLMGPAWDKLCKWSRTLWSRARLTYVCVLVTQSCLTLCDPMDCSLPGSSVYGILQARVLELVAMSFSRGSCLCHCRQILFHLSLLQSPMAQRVPSF